MITEQINSIKNKYHISDEVLAHILNISISELNEISNNKQVLHDIEQNGKNIQSALLMLDEGISMIPSDERLHGVIDDLINLYLLSPETICLYGEISEKNFNLYYYKNKEIDVNMKFDFSVKIFMLFAIIKRDMVL